MKPPAVHKPIAPSASSTPPRSLGQPFSHRASHGFQPLPLADKAPAHWLFAEDEYFPFDADGFEER
jgi:hypothetical protein